MQAASSGRQIEAYFKVRGGVVDGIRPEKTKILREKSLQFVRRDATLISG